MKAIAVSERMILGAVLMRVVVLAVVLMRTMMAIVMVMRVNLMDGTHLVKQGMRTHHRPTEDQ